MEQVGDFSRFLKLREVYLSHVTLKRPLERQRRIERVVLNQVELAETASVSARELVVCCNVLPHGSEMVSISCSGGKQQKEAFDWATSIGIRGAGNSEVSVDGKGSRLDVQGVTIVPSCNVLLPPS